MASVCFEVHGDFITELARERYKETKDVNVGVAFLRGCINSMPEEIAAMIVMGKKKLVGVNEVTLEDDDVVVVPYGWIMPSDISTVECGWISPDGECFGDPYYNSRDNHIILAKRICERFYPDAKNDDWALEDNGWIKLCPYQATMYSTEHKATEKQKDALAEFCRTHQRKIVLGNYSSEYFSGNDLANMDILMFNKII